MTSAADRTRERLQEFPPVQSDVIRRRVVVHGRVQGVFFRDSVRQRAEAHGVAGWARNRDDGAVEVVLEGQPDAVRRLLRFLETGPPNAQVGHTEVEEQDPEGLSEFATQ